MSPTVLRDTRFSNHRLQAVGVEVLSASELRRRVSEHRLREAERIDFFLLLITRQGRGAHVVDFERIALAPGRVVFVRPGQVQQWVARSTYEAEILLIEPTALLTGSAAPASPAVALLDLDEWSSHFDLDTTEFAACNQLMALLARELASEALTPVSAVLARELLLCLMLSLHRPASRQAMGANDAHLLARRFQRALETSVRERPSVAALAWELDVSSSTLNRACRSRFGRSAKVLTDRRVALEAQRMLVHSRATSAAIGDQLGFTEPTNFLKFFRRVVGETPEAFRRSHTM